MNCIEVMNEWTHTIALYSHLETFFLMCFSCSMARMVFSTWVSPLLASCCACMITASVTSHFFTDISYNPNISSYTLFSVGKTVQAPSLLPRYFK